MAESPPAKVPRLESSNVSHTSSNSSAPRIGAIDTDSIEYEWLGPGLDFRAWYHGVALNYSDYDTSESKAGSDVSSLASADGSVAVVHKLEDDICFLGGCDSAAVPNEFEWPDEETPDYQASVVIQRAFRAYLSRRLLKEYITGYCGVKSPSLMASMVLVYPLVNP